MTLRATLHFPPCRLLPIALLACACADAPPLETEEDTPQILTADPIAAASEAPMDDRVFPPDDWTPTATAHREGWVPTLCLTFDGLRVSDDESFIVPKGETVRVPAFDVRPYGVADRGTAIAAVVARVRWLYRGTPLQIVTDCPNTEAYTRIVVGGRPQLVGEADGVAGIAPFDVGNRADDDIGFAFAGVLGEGRGTPDLEQLADVIAHEAAHTYGLDHVTAEPDVMYPVVNDSMRGFTAAEAVDGHWQDGPALLAAALATEGVAPTPGSPGKTGGDDADSPCDPEGERSGTARDRAKPLAPEQVVEGVACSGDEDWYQVDARSGDVLEFELAYPSEAWVDSPAVFAPRARVAGGAEDDSAGLHRVEVDATRDGKYRVRITTQGGDPVRYALRVRGSSAPQ